MVYPVLQSFSLSVFQSRVYNLITHIPTKNVKSRDPIGYKKKAIIAVSSWILSHSKHCQAWFPCMSGWMLMCWPPERVYYVKEFFISQGRPLVTLSHWHITKPGPGLGDGDRVRWRHPRPEKHNNERPSCSQASNDFCEMFENVEL